MIRFKQAVVTFIAITLFSACSRPMATFQPSPPSRFYSTQAVIVSQQPVDQEVDSETKPNVPVLVEFVVMPKTLATAATASLKQTYVPEKTTTQRLERVERQLAQNSVPTTAQPVAARKTSFLQQLTLKKMAKTMQRKLAPKQTKEITGNARLGLIIAGVGLIFLLIGNSVGSILGLIALLAGGALFFYSMLQQ